MAVTQHIRFDCLELLDIRQRLLEIETRWWYRRFDHVDSRDAHASSIGGKHYPSVGFVEDHLRWCIPGRVHGLELAVPEINGITALNSSQSVFHNCF